MKTLVQYNLKWNLLRCVKTDEDKNLYGSRRRLSWINLQSIWKYKMFIHCYLWVGTLQKNFELWRIIESVVSTVNLILSWGPNHQFCAVLSETEIAYHDLLYLIEIWWLRSGKIHVLSSGSLQEKNTLSHCYWTLYSFGNLFLLQNW